MEKKIILCIVASALALTSGALPFLVNRNEEYFQQNVEDRTYGETPEAFQSYVDSMPDVNAFYEGNSYRVQLPFSASIDVHVEEEDKENNLKTDTYFYEYVVCGDDAYYERTISKEVKKTNNTNTLTSYISVEFYVAKGVFQMRMNTNWFEESDLDDDSLHGRLDKTLLAHQREWLSIDASSSSLNDNPSMEEIVAYYTGEYCKEWRSLCALYQTLFKTYFLLYELGQTEYHKESSFGPYDKNESRFREIGKSYGTTYNGSLTFKMESYGLKTRPIEPEKVKNADEVFAPVVRSYANSHGGN